MKVVILSSSDKSGGAAIASSRLHLALKKHDVNSQMLVRYKVNHIDPTIQAINQLARFATVEAHPRFIMEKLFFLFHEKSITERFAFSTNKFGFNVSANQLVRGADIIHLHWINQGFISLKGLKNLFSLKKPVVWTLHDMWPFTGGCHYSGTCQNYKLNCGNCPFLRIPSNNDLSNKVLIKKRKYYKNSNISVVACSNWLAAKARESDLFRNFNVITIPNPIDIEIFKPANKEDVRLRMGLPSDKKILLIGSAKLTDKRKGFEKLLAAFQILDAKNPELKDKIYILLFGQISEFASQQIPFHVKSLGMIETPELAYQCADIFILPSLEDNLPNTVMEALSCGVPCIAFKTGGIPEMIDHDENGYLCQYASEKDLADGIIWALNRADLKLLSLNARAKVLKNYSEESVARQYIKLYSQLLNG